MHKTSKSILNVVIFFLVLFFLNVWRIFVPIPGLSVFDQLLQLNLAIAMVPFLISLFFSFLPISIKRFVTLLIIPSMLFSVFLNLVSDFFIVTINRTGSIFEIFGSLATKTVHMTVISTLLLLFTLFLIFTITKRGLESKRTNCPYFDDISAEDTKGQKEFRKPTEEEYLFYQSLQKTTRTIRICLIIIFSVALITTILHIALLEAAFMKNFPLILGGLWFFSITSLFCALSSSVDMRLLFERTGLPNKKE